MSVAAEEVDVPVREVVALSELDVVDEVVVVVGTGPGGAGGCAAEVQVKRVYASRAGRWRKDRMVTVNE